VPTKNKWCDNTSGNDEAQMTNDETTSKFKIRYSKFATDWPSAQVLSFRLRHPVVIRHLDFVI
jgi:hypothetical protein